MKLRLLLFLWFLCLGVSLRAEQTLLEQVTAIKADSAKAEDYLRKADSLQQVEAIKSITLSEMAANLTARNETPYLQARALFQLARLYRLTNQIRLSEIVSERLDNWAEKTRIPYIRAVSELNRGELRLKTNNLAEAIELFTKANKSAIRLKAIGLEKPCAFGLAMAYAEIKDFNLAYSYLKRYETLKDSLYNIESNEQLRRLQNKFDTDRLQTRLNVQNREKEVQASEIRSQRMLVNLLAISLLFIVLLFVVLFSRYRLIQRANKKLQEKDDTIELQKHENDEIQQLLNLLETQKREIEAQKDQMNEANDQLEKAFKRLEIDNLHKTAELDEARELQLSILPKTTPIYPELEIAAYMQTANEVGGDFYDFFVNKDGSLHFALGDATGKGLKAAFVVAVAKSYYQFLAPSHSDWELMDQLSRGIQAMNVSDMFLAMLLARYQNRKISFVAAGMPPIYLYSRRKKTLHMVELAGMFLGTNFDVPYDTLELELETGDLVLLMSDGLPELANPSDDPFGYERVIEVLHDIEDISAQEVIDRLVREAENWSAGMHFDDDVTILAIKVKV